MNSINRQRRPLPLLLLKGLAVLPTILLISNSYAEDSINTLPDKLLWLDTSDSLVITEDNYLSQWQDKSEQGRAFRVFGKKGQNALSQSQRFLAYDERLEVRMN